MHYIGVLFSLVFFFCLLESFLLLAACFPFSLILGVWRESRHGVAYWLVRWLLARGIDWYPEKLYIEGRLLDVN